jgi:hypothetical protein
MAEGERKEHPALVQFPELAVFQNGKNSSLHRTKLSHVCSYVTKVKLQLEDDKGDMQVFIGFICECELPDEPLPAIAS